MLFRRSFFGPVVVFVVALALAGCPTGPTKVAPTASFTASQTSGGAPLSVTFTDTSTAGSAPITQWSWTFGDGGTSSIASPSHTFSIPGTYPISLKVSSADGDDTVTGSRMISVSASCNLSSVQLTQPQNGANVVVNSGLPETPVLFSAEPNCAADTAAITFTLDGAPAGEHNRSETEV